MLSLDVLRFVAIALVIIHHCWAGWLNSVPIPKSISLAAMHGGWIGVDLFFVLSGYLVARLLFREYAKHGSIRVGRFLIRRGLKIYPAFYVFFAITLVVSWVNTGRIPERWWSEALFLQSYFGGAWGHTWSLAIEEHFYIGLPVFLFILVARDWRECSPLSRYPMWCAIGCIIVLTLRCIAVLSQPEFEPFTHFKPTHLRVDALIFGSLLAFLHTFKTQSFESFCSKYFWFMLAAGIWLLTPAFLGKLKAEPFLYSLGFTQIYIGSGCIVSALLVRGIPRNALTVLMAKIGTYSYSIYLWHLAVRRWGINWSADLYGESLSPLAELSIYVFGSILIGVLMSKLVEFPVLKLRDRLFPSAIDLKKKERLVEYELAPTREPKPAVAIAREASSTVESSSV